MKLHWKLMLTVALAYLGYLGAAVFYSYLIGIRVQTEYLCLFCPHLFVVGDASTPHQKFVHYVLSYGTFNAVLFVAVGWVLFGLARLVRWFI
ncbi:MAG: hypothetical protein WB952_20095 [Terriglobales bacterium]